MAATQTSVPRTDYFILILDVEVENQEGERHVIRAERFVYDRENQLVAFFGPWIYRHVPGGLVRLMGDVTLDGHPRSTNIVTMSFTADELRNEFTLAPIEDIVDEDDDAPVNVPDQLDPAEAIDADVGAEVIDHYEGMMEEQAAPQLDVHDDALGDLAEHVVATDTGVLEVEDATVVTEDTPSPQDAPDDPDQAVRVEIAADLKHARDNDEWGPDGR